MFFSLLQPVNGVQVLITTSLFLLAQAAIASSFGTIIVSLTTMYASLWLHNVSFFVYFYFTSNSLSEVFLGKSLEFFFNFINNFIFNQITSCFRKFLNCFWGRLKWIYDIFSMSKMPVAIFKRSSFYLNFYQYIAYDFRKRQKPGKFYKYSIPRLYWLTHQCLNITL